MIRCSSMELKPSVNTTNIVNINHLDIDEYVQSDLASVYNPNFHEVRCIRGEGLIDCECCDEWVDSNDPSHEGMIFRYDPDSVNYRLKIKMIYCADCLNHIGINTCPSVRGVPAYKTVDPTIVDRIIKSR